MKKSKLKAHNKALEMRVAQLEGRIELIGKGVLQELTPEELVCFLKHGVKARTVPVHYDAIVGTVQHYDNPLVGELINPQPANTPHESHI